MRLATYERGGKRRLGAYVGDTLADLPAAVGDPSFPETMEGLVGAGRGALEAARAVLADEEAAARHAVGEPRLLAPILPASLRDFFGFEDHVKRGAERRGTEIPEAWYEMPVYYKGNHREIYGPDDEVPWPAYTDELDYELEVACILGGRGRDLSEDEAVGLVFGYTLMNDWSARDIQRKEMTVWLGPAKGKDFATSLGPVLVTADELDPSDVALTVRLDGKTLAEGNLGDARWTFPQMIAYVSQAEDVVPGDLYGSGTFGGGCGLDFGHLLEPGQSIELEAAGIGVLRNRVGPKPQ